MKPFACIIRWVTISVLLLMPTVAVADAQQPFEGMQQQVWLATLARLDETRTGRTPTSPPIPVARFYRMIGHRPVWMDVHGLSSQGEDLLRVIGECANDGLDPDDYLLPPQITPWIDPVDFSDTIDPSDLKWHIQLDVALTEALLRYATHLSRGRIAPPTRSPIRLMDQPSKARDLPTDLAAAVKADRLNAFLEELQPGQRAYRRLKSALGQHERIRASGGWPLVPSGPALHRGDQGPRVSALRSRLTLSQDLTAHPPLGADSYDQTLEAAVMRFQHRHGLEPDGVVGKQTLAALSVPLESRIRQLRLNMERWRWYPDSLGRRYLMVNVPDYTLSVMEDGWEVRRMRAIVGKQRRQTPILSARMTYLEFNPYWNIPRKIARKDILPKILNDPEYLIKQGIKVYGSWDRDTPALDPHGIAWDRLTRTYFPYRLRQDPSRHNALGQVKFMFPNRQSIYIHDTPAKSLFDRPQRAYSSGCVRVENPLALAQYLLRDQHWDRSRLEAAIDAGRQRSVVLKRPVPVFLVYFTAWVGESGGVHFRQDVYGRDRELELALNQCSAPRRVSNGDGAGGRLLASCSPESR